MTNSTFKKDLTKLINQYALENESNTPDFLLAEYLEKCLLIWNETMVKREKWYGR